MQMICTLSYVEYKAHCFLCNASSYHLKIVSIDPKYSFTTTLTVFFFITDFCGGQRSTVVKI